jgi:hypothetical protein
VWEVWEKESAVPPAFSEAFLEWFRHHTETTWSVYPAPSIQRFAERRMLGCEWQPGTRWLRGLEEEQVAAVEHAWALLFPPDYRLFLRRLHAVDRPLRCTAWGEAQAGKPPPSVLRDAPAFYNWLTDGAIVQRRLDELATGLVFEVEENALWRPSWGTRPATAERRAQAVRQLVAKAPRLIPIFGHRYLLAEPCRAGNPVFSIMQADIVVYGADVRSYLLVECLDLLNLDTVQVRRTVDDLIKGRFPEYTAIPFWGDLLAH